MFRVWRLAADLGGRLVVAQPLVDDLAQQIVVGPGQEFDLGDQFKLIPSGASNETSIGRQLSRRERRSPVARPGFFIPSNWRGAAGFAMRRPLPNGTVPP
jgi:hypothetical protein